MWINPDGLTETIEQNSNLSKEQATNIAYAVAECISNAVDEHLYNYKHEELI